MYEQDVVADVSTQLTLGDFDIPVAVLLRCPPCRTLREQVEAIWTRSVSSATRTVFFVAADCTAVCAINRSASSSACSLSHPASCAQVVTQHVDEVLFVGDVRKEDILRHRQVHISSITTLRHVHC